MAFALLKIKVGDELKSLEHISAYKGQLIDIDGDGAGTSENGVTIRDVRRRNKCKLTVKFEGLSQKEFTELMDVIDRESFELTYFRGAFKTITAHAGDRNFELVKAAGDTVSLWSLDVSFIEY